MNLELLGNIVIGLLLIGWIGYRQTTWRPVVVSKMWRMPLILGVIGLFMLTRAGTPVTGLDIAFLLVELAISLGVGAWMGALARFRHLDSQRAVGGKGDVALYESRTGWWGLALWLLVIAVRVGIDVIAMHAGARAATTMGVVLLLLAANRVARVGVFAARLDRHRAARLAVEAEPAVSAQRAA